MQLVTPGLSTAKQALVKNKRLKYLNFDFVSFLISFFAGACFPNEHTHSFKRLFCSKKNPLIIIKFSVHH